MISRFDALMLIETDVLLADDRKDCVDVVRRRVNQIYDSFENSNDFNQVDTSNFDKLDDKSCMENLFDLLDRFRLSSGEDFK